jgi:hypothetical protein
MGHRATVTVLAATLLVWTAGVPAASAQAVADERTFALSPTLGIGSLGGPALRASAALGTREGVFSLRASIVSDFELFVEPWETVWDVGVLYGRRADGERGYGSISAGIALTGGMQRGASKGHPGCFLFCVSIYEEKPFTTIGIPFEADAVWSFARGAGIGLSGFGNLNPVRPVVGAGVSLYLGALR